MKNMTKTLVGATIAASLALVGTPAFATDAPEQEVWQAWITPLGSTPENVLYDQIVDTEANRATLACGTTYLVQNDLYLQSERDRFVADGKLTYKEDWGNEYQRGAISWYFTEFTTPDCAPVLTAVTPVTPTVAVTGQCVDETWTEVAIVTVPYVENGRYDVGNGFVPGGFEFPFPQTSELTIPFQPAEGSFVLTEAADWRIENGTSYTTLTRPYIEPENCTVTPPEVVPEEPVVTPPVVEPPVVVPPVEEPVTPATVEPVTHTALAETGPEDDARFGVFATLAGLALLIGGVYIVTKRRDNDPDGLA